MYLNNKNAKLSTKIYGKQGTVSRVNRHNRDNKPSIINLCGASV